jgi:hypothetical protein
MRADIHDGPEHMLQLETEYIDAIPHQPASTKTSCTARPDHPFGSKTVLTPLNQDVCFIPDCVAKPFCSGRANFLMAAEAFSVSGREDHVNLDRFAQRSSYSL